jgi:hypothetical protein
VASRERRLPRPRHPDECDEAELGDLEDGHLVNTAICVGNPTAGSSVPTPESTTE